jgi:Sulfotransferase family
MTTSADPSAAASPTLPQRIPDFFVVGHAKSGTTALYEMLRQHPQIYMADLKETLFFAPELHPCSRRSAMHPETLADYRALFGAARSEQCIGEASPSYLRSRTAAKRIAVLQPDARIVAILREPASFLRSFHLQCVQNRFEPETDLRRALALEGARREGKKIPRDAGLPLELMYSEHVRYAEQLRRYHAVFPPEQVLVLLYDDFRADNEGTVRRLLRFLDLDDRAPIEVTEANPTVRVRSPLMDELVRTVSFGSGRAARPAKAAIKALTPRRLRRDGLRTLRRRVLYSEPRPPDERLMLELRRRFKGEVDELSAYLDRDLVRLWGYDGID